MAPQLKLVYFDGRGRGEATRITLVAGGIKFEDYRLKDGEWPSYKSKTPFGHVPMLIVDGKEELSESGTLLRYAASLAGLAGKTPLERAKADMLADAFADICSAAYGFKFAPAETKDAAKEKFFTETLNPFLNRVEKILAKNGTDYFVGNSLTFADIQSFVALSDMVGYESSALDKHPLVKAHTDRIATLPKIKTWLENRPTTEF